MNFNGEAYTPMIKAGQPWKPVRGQLPDALQEVPSSRAQFELAKSGRYSDSTVEINGVDYPIAAFIRDLNPDPANPVLG